MVIFAKLDVPDHAVHFDLFQSFDQFVAVQRSGFFDGFGQHVDAVVRGARSMPAHFRARFFAVFFGIVIVVGDRGGDGFHWQRADLEDKVHHAFHFAVKCFPRGAGRDRTDETHQQRGDLHRLGLLDEDTRLGHIKDRQDHICFAVLGFGQRGRKLGRADWVGIMPEDGPTALLEPRLHTAAGALGPRDVLVNDVRFGESELFAQKAHRLGQVHDKVRRVQTEPEKVFVLGVILGHLLLQHRGHADGRQVRDLVFGDQIHRGGQNFGPERADDNRIQFLFKNQFFDGLQGIVYGDARFRFARVNGFDLERAFDARDVDAAFRVDFLDRHFH